MESCRSAGAQSALSIKNGVNQLMSMGTAVLGGWLGDRYGKQAVLTVVFLLIIWTIVVQAFTTSFTVVVLVNAWGGLMGGMLGGPINGLMADVLPTGSDGKPTHPTRDWNLICQAWSIPGILWPLILGSAFNWFPSKRATYTWFFIINAALNTIQIPVLYPLDFSEGAGKGQGARKPRGAWVGWRVARYGAPVGARLCDRLCFRGTVERLEGELPERPEGAPEGGGGAGGGKGSER